MTQFQRDAMGVTVDQWDDVLEIGVGLFADADPAVLHTRIELTVRNGRALYEVLRGDWERGTVLARKVEGSIWPS